MSKFVLGNCVDVMSGMPAGVIDFVLTDPPYLVSYKDRAGRTIQNDSNSDWLVPAFEQIYRVMKDGTFCVSFYGWSKLDLFFEAWRKAGFRVVGHFTCPKKYASSKGFVAYQHESAFLLAKGNVVKPDNPISDILPWDYTGNKLHPTQKPLSALLPLVSAFSQPGDIVLDPFAGSGSTCAAARTLGRRYFGIELSPEYYAAAQGRLCAMKDESQRLAA